MLQVIEMSNETLTLEQVFEETGMAARWKAKFEARGEARGVAIGEARGEAKAEARLKGKEALEIAQNMINLGLPFDIIVSATKLDPEKVKELFKN